ncbi:hypothetical protein N7510_001675 [Penicillium lagena]|uniref:uncharacterized protein n=1 Tax=Penicillium lagena TaxID=94218 RepID=UPI002541743C|nr:uncharacterized protein N7510_001675 [Penicillium lagena]KAJ5625366.1 hypothetical protein N7510_001675 [Penicillium lagena]
MIPGTAAPNPVALYTLPNGKLIPELVGPIEPQSPSPFAYPHLTGLWLATSDSTRDLGRWTSHLCSILSGLGACIMPDKALIDSEMIDSDAVTSVPVGDD